MASETGFRIPGCASLLPTRTDTKGNHYIDLVPHMHGLTPFNPADASHRAARRVAFLVDTGAEMSVIGPESLAVLTDLNSFEGCPITGFSGVPSQPLATGILVIVPPDGAIDTPGRPSAPGVTYTSATVSRITT